MLHAGVLMKLGAYGVVRLGMGLLPDGANELAWLVGGIACINVVYGALSAHGADRPQVRHRLLVGLAHGRWSCWARPRSPRRGSTARCSRCSPTA